MSTAPEKLSNTVNCDECNVSFYSTSQLRNHVLSRHSPQCTVTYTNAKGVKETESLVRVQDCFICPRCQKGFTSKGGIRKHLIKACVELSTANNDDLEEEISDAEALTSSSRKRKAKSPNESNDAARNNLIETTCGIFPIEMVTYMTKAMNLSPFIINDSTSAIPDSSIFLDKNTVSLLQLKLKEGFTIMPLDFEKKERVILPTEGYEDITAGNHLHTIEAGGATGLERLAGAIITTGKATCRILALEVYNRDICSDPHAESIKAYPSSVPTRSSVTQYTGQLKIVILCDNFQNRRLIIGVRDHNYLVTALECDGSAEVGPSRCAKFPISESTKLFISCSRCGSSLDGTVIGLAQVRSCFFHPATYSTRRGAMIGSASLSQLPVTVFTLSQWKVPFSMVFYNLWKRSREAGDKIVLRVGDLDNPTSDDQRSGAKICRRLLALFDENGMLDVTASGDAEALLSSLAASHSSTISNMNRDIATTIIDK